MICPNDPQLRGISTWEELQQSDFHAGDKLVLCPGTRLDAAQSITVHQGGHFTIQCGRNGNLKDLCVIEGGSRQINLINVESATFQGIHFRFAESAVSIEGANAPGAVFENCAFELNDSTDSGLDGAAANVLFGGVARFRKVTFYGNMAFSGIVNVYGGHAIFEECVFENNFSVAATMNLGGGVIQVYGSSSTVSVRYSCFLQNTAPSVSISNGNGALVSRVDDTNYSAGKHCQGIWDEQFKACSPFEGEVCDPLRESEMPSMFPSRSVAPSYFPSSAPSLSSSPSLSPSSQPSLVPSDWPSTFPSNEPSLLPSDMPSSQPSVLEYPPLPPEQPSAEPSSVVSIIIFQEGPGRKPARTHLIGSLQAEDSKSSAERTKNAWPFLPGVYWTVVCFLAVGFIV